MTGLNHISTGGVIGLAISNPVALPVAFGAHYVLDAIPHFGKHPSWQDRRKFWAFMALDGLLSLIMLVSLWFISNGSWLVVGSAILCALPDVMHAVDLTGKHYNKSFSAAKYDPTYNFHIKIQTSETPQGAIVELIWFGFMTAAIVVLT
jgi:hypothetical protein